MNLNRILPASSLILFLASGLLAVEPSSGGRNGDVAQRGPTDFSSTFSIVAADPQSGLCGAAVASKYPAVGRVVPYARAGVGAFCTQHYHVPEWGERALDLLAAGKSPQQVVAELLAGDPRPEQRQLAVIDAAGRAASHNPSLAPRSSRYWGSISGPHFSVQGNTLAGRKVLAEMAAGYEETEGTFADRLIASLLAGDRAGGDHRGRLAAGIRVCKPGESGYWLELYVDESDDAVEDLVALYNRLEHPARGTWRAPHP